MTRPVTDILREINKGKFAEEVTDELAHLVPACRAAGASGEIVIKLKLKPGRSGSNVVEVIPSYTVKKPKAEVPTEIFFATQGGALVRDNPDQGKLELTVVDTRPVPLPVVAPGQVPVRELVDATTGEVIRAITLPDGTVGTLSTAPPAPAASVPIPPASAATP